MDLHQLIHAARPFVTGLMSKPGAFARSGLRMAGPAGMAATLYDTVSPTPANQGEPGGASWSTPMKSSDIPGDTFAQRFQFPMQPQTPQAPAPGATEPVPPLGIPGVVPAPRASVDLPTPPAPTPPPNFGGISGMNPALGNMADPSQLGVDPQNLGARQVMDQSSGQMVNDYFSKKPWQQFDAPGHSAADQPMLHKFLSLIGAA